jgi:hypothetical protein
MLDSFRWCFFPSSLGTDPFVSLKAHLSSFKEQNRDLRWTKMSLWTWRSARHFFCFSSNWIQDWNEQNEKLLVAPDRGWVSEFLFNNNLFVGFERFFWQMGTSQFSQPIRWVWVSRFRIIKMVPQVLSSHQLLRSFRNPNPTTFEFTIATPWIA